MSRSTMPNEQAANSGGFFLGSCLCTMCKQTKSLDAFGFDRSCQKYRRRCRKCENAVRRAHYADSPELQTRDHERSRKNARTPDERAAWRRAHGVTASDVPYVPQAEIARIAAEKRAARLHDAHARLWAEVTRFEAARHNAHVKEFKRRLESEKTTIRFRTKYKTDPEFALKQRLRTQARKKAKLFPKLDDLIRAAINRGGESRTVADVCGYTIADLKIHLEALFSDGMCWDAFLMGLIHIDHIQPQRLFDLSDIDQVRACWALSNLQPLWKSDNLKKSDRIDWHALEAA